MNMSYPYRVCVLVPTVKKRVLEMKNENDKTDRSNRFDLDQCGKLAACGTVLRAQKLSL